MKTTSPSSTKHSDKRDVKSSQQETSPFKKKKKLDADQQKKSNILANEEVSESLNTKDKSAESYLKKSSKNISSPKVDISRKQISKEDPVVNKSHPEVKVSPSVKKKPKLESEHK